jgi:ferritin-like metal-binding protein YciE
MPNQTVKQQAPLMDQFGNALFILIKLEQQLSKIFVKLERTAFTPELTKALTPEISDQSQHLARLKLICTSLKLKKLNGAVNKELIPQVKLSRKKSSMQDLAIINYALQLQNLKLGHYEFIHSLAKGFSIEIESNLIEQTITDNRNTNTWLRQIIQNIIAPQLLEHS